MPYQDPPTKSKHVAWFVVLAILMLGWNFWLPELRNHEAMIGVTARELLAHGHPWRSPTTESLPACGRW